MKRLIVQSKHFLVFVPHDKIIYCKSDGAYTVIILDDERQYTLSRSLTKIQEVLDQSIFIKINQSFLVNKYLIKRVDKRKKIIEMINEDELNYSITLRQLKSHFATQ